MEALFVNIVSPIIVGVTLAFVSNWLEQRKK